MKKKQGVVRCNVEGYKSQIQIAKVTWDWPIKSLTEVDKQLEE